MSTADAAASPNAWRVLGVLFVAAQVAGLAGCVLGIGGAVGSLVAEDDGWNSLRAVLSLMLLVPAVGVVGIGRAGTLATRRRSGSARVLAVLLALLMLTPLVLLPDFPGTWALAAVAVGLVAAAALARREIDSHL